MALPEEMEESEPRFSHHPAHTLPEFLVGDVKIRLLVGEAFGRKSPVPAYSNLFYLEALMPAGSRLEFPFDGREAAVYVAKGEVTASGEPLHAFAMGVARPTEGLSIEASEESRVMLLGGDIVGPRQIYWNFVSSSRQAIEDAKRDWRKGPGSQRFPKIPGDQSEYIPLPEGD